MTNLSVILDKIEVTEIGLIWESSCGDEIFGRGLIEAHFHCFGTSELIKERLIIWVKGSLITGAASFKNQNGKPSGPDDVDSSLSKLLKTDISSTRSNCS